MITAFIFFIHLIFSLVIFTKKWQEENISSALLNLGLVGILFAVGWSITGMFSKAIMEPEGFGLYFDRDTFSLVLLTIAEYFFYRMYFKDLFTEDGKEIQ
jgi:uncharacterized membrane protein YhdT